MYNMCYVYDDDFRYKWKIHKSVFTLLFDVNSGTEVKEEKAEE